MGLTLLQLCLLRPVLRGKLTRSLWPDGHLSYLTVTASPDGHLTNLTIRIHQGCCGQQASGTCPLKAQVFPTLCESETMKDKIPSGERVASPRLSLASRLLGAAFRSAGPVPLSEEPWRNRKPKGKNRRKGRK